MRPTRLVSLLVIGIALLAVVATLTPFLSTAAPGPLEIVSVRGETVRLHGSGPYRHMPADIAVQGLAQDLVTLAVAVPLLIGTLVWAHRGSRAGHVALTGVVAYVFVQYVLYLAMATYNELFLVWVGLVLLSFQALVRLLLAAPSAAFTIPADAHAVRRYVGGFLLLNGTLITLLWLAVVVPPLLSGTLYPAGLAHLTTMIVQGFDLALFLPPSLLAGYWYWTTQEPGDLLAPVYAVFVAVQLLALIAKIAWMYRVGVDAGPALVMIPALWLGAMAAAGLSLRRLSTGAP